MSDKPTITNDGPLKWEIDSSLPGEVEVTPGRPLDITEKILWILFSFLGPDEIDLTEGNTEPFASHISRLIYGLEIRIRARLDYLYELEKREGSLNIRAFIKEEIGLLKIILRGLIPHLPSIFRKLKGATPYDILYSRMRLKDNDGNLLSKEAYRALFEIYSKAITTSMEDGITEEWTDLPKLEAPKDIPIGISTLAKSAFAGLGILLSKIIEDEAVSDFTIIIIAMMIIMDFIFHIGEDTNEFRVRNKLNVIMIYGLIVLFFINSFAHEQLQPPQVELSTPPSSGDIINLGGMDVFQTNTDDVGFNSTHPLVVLFPFGNQTVNGYFFTNTYEALDSMTSDGITDATEISRTTLPFQDNSENRIDAFQSIEFIKDKNNNYIPIRPYLKLNHSLTAVRVFGIKPNGEISDNILTEVIEYSDGTYGIIPLDDVEIYNVLGLVYSSIETEESRPHRPAGSDLLTSGLKNIGLNQINGVNITDGVTIEELKQGISSRPYSVETVVGGNHPILDYFNYVLSLPGTYCEPANKVELIAAAKAIEINTSLGFEEFNSQLKQLVLATGAINSVDNTIRLNELHGYGLIDGIPEDATPDQSISSDSTTSAYIESLLNQTADDSGDHTTLINTVMDFAKEYSNDAEITKLTQSLEARGSSVEDYSIELFLLKHGTALLAVALMLGLSSLAYLAFRIRQNSLDKINDPEYLSKKELNLIKKLSNEENLKILNLIAQAGSQLFNSPESIKDAKGKFLLDKFYFTDSILPFELTISTILTAIILHGEKSRVGGMFKSLDWQWDELDNIKFILTHKNLKTEKEIGKVIELLKKFMKNAKLVKKYRFTTKIYEA